MVSGNAPDSILLLLFLPTNGGFFASYKRAPANISKKLVANNQHSKNVLILEYIRNQTKNLT
jgi:hypothetical protein